MKEPDRITPETASVLARWAGLKETESPEHLTETLENVRQIIERLYAVDVEGFEADFLQSETRAR